MRHFGQPQVRLDGSRHLLGNAVLQVEDVGKLAVELVGPEVVANLGLDELTRDADPSPRLPDGTLKDVAHAEVPADLAYIDSFALVDEGGVSGDDEEPADAGQRGDDVLDHTIGEVLLLGLSADVHEGKN